MNDDVEQPTPTPTSGITNVPENTPANPVPSAHKWRAGVVLAQAGGFCLSLVALLVVTFLLLGIPPAKGLEGIWVGAVGDSTDGHWQALSETLVKTTPLLLTGLGIVVAWRAGVFSIGGEGQLLVGALAAMAVAKVGGFVPAPLLTLLMLVSGVLAGAFWGGIAGWLRVRRNVQEVISTIMLNYVALYLVGVLLAGPLQEHTHISQQSDPLPDAVLFARLIPTALAGGNQTRLHSGVCLALLAVPIIWMLQHQTAVGFGMRVVGQNPEAARVARFSVDSLRMRAMLISGGLCGLAGTIELLGVNGRLDANFSPGWGYTAIPVALLGGLDPLGALFSALFFGGLTAGCGYLSRFYGVSAYLIYVIQAAAVLAVVGGRAWRSRRSGSSIE